MIKSKCIGFSVLLAFVISVDAKAAYTNFFNAANGHHYALTMVADDFLAVRAEAQSLGYELVTINDAAENSWILSTFKNQLLGDDRAWIGYSDELSEGTWIWDNGENPGYENWHSSEPNGGSREDYAEIYLDVVSPGDNGFWNDNGATEPNFGIIESVSRIVPEPESLVLMFSALCCCITRRRR